MKFNNLIIYLIIIQLCFIQRIGFCATKPNYRTDNTSSQIGVNSDFHISSHEVIVRLNSESSFNLLKNFSQTMGAESLTNVFSPNTPAGQHQILNRIYHITFPLSSSINKIEKTYMKQSYIEAVELNRLSRFCSEISPNDTRFNEQWNLTSMNMSKAWQIERGKPSVVVAVVDSGIQVNHPDIENQLWQNADEIPMNSIDDDNNGYVDDFIGWDFTDAPTLQGHGDWKVRDNQPNDETGHGTQVSGIIAAETNNTKGIAGIAPDCRIMTLRAGFRIGGGAFLQNDDVAAAIVYAADNGAQVINLSLGDTVNAFLIRDAVEYAYNRGCLLIAAAGNSAESGSLYPAALHNVISVAALDRDWQLGGSNFGSSIDIAAPGEDILTTDLFNHNASINERYGYKSGTSMAAAHVSGVAALLFSANPSCSNNQVQQWLTNSTRQLTVPQLVGAGLIDAYAALTVKDEPIANIEIHQGYQDNVIEITGSAGGKGFIHYWIDYGISETPDLWFPIGSPHTKPIYNSILQKWDISELDDGLYTLRLSVKSDNGKTIRDKAVIEILHNLPTSFNHEGSEWLTGNRYNSNVIWQTDVLTSGSVEIYKPTNIQTPIRIAYSDSVHTQHLINVSNLKLASGEYLYTLKSQNRSGLVYTDDNNGQFYTIKVSDKLINNSHLKKILSTNQSHQVIVSPIDMNGNGKIELIALDKNSKIPHVYELDENSNFVLKESLELYELDDNNNFVLQEPNEHTISLLWDIRDLDGDGLIEILANGSDSTFLLEQPEQGKFPTHQIWKANSIWGGTFADTDLDNIYEIISRHDSSNSIWIYEPVGNNSYPVVATLDNPTQGKNTLFTRFAIADFDSDGKIEILAGDSDSELFIYENIGDNLYQHTWTQKLVYGIPSLFGSGDLNGDTIPEFVVGAKVWTTEFDLPRQHWNITIFTSNGDNSYHAEWNLRIRELLDGLDGLAIADADNDGKNELCIATPPNFYLIQHDGTSYSTIWHHPSASTFNPIVTDIDNDGNNELMFNSTDGFTVFSNIQNNGINSNNLNTKSVKSNSVPLIASAVHSPPHQIILSFNTQMDVSTANPSLYLLHRVYQPENSAQMGNKSTESASNNGQFFVPQSAIFDKSKKRVILTFERNVFNEKYQYQIETLGLSDIQGTNIPEGKRKTNVELNENTISGLIVYPNPARGNVVTFDKLQADSSVNIYDVSGNRITTLNSTEIIHSINRCKLIWSLDGISSGVYIYVVESDAQQIIGKVTVLQ